MSGVCKRTKNIANAKVTIATMKPETRKMRIHDCHFIDESFCTYCTLLVCTSNFTDAIVFISHRHICTVSMLMSFKINGQCSVARGWTKASQFHLKILVIILCAFREQLNVPFSITIRMSILLATVRNGICRWRYQINSLLRSLARQTDSERIRSKLKRLLIFSQAHTTMKNSN